MTERCSAKAYGSHGGAQQPLSAPPAIPPFDGTSGSYFAAVLHLMALAVPTQDRLRLYRELQRTWAGRRICVPTAGDAADAGRRGAVARLMLDAGTPRSEVVDVLKRRFGVSERTAYRDVGAAIQLCHALPLRGRNGGHDAANDTEHSQEPPNHATPV